MHIVGRETPAEVASRRWIGNATRTQGIEKHFVLATQFQVLNAGAAAQRIEGQIENVIGLVIRVMNYQELQAFVNRLAEADPAGQEQHGADATMGDTADAAGKLVIDVPRCEHGPLRIAIVGLVQASLEPTLALSELLPLNPPLAIRPFSSYDRFHSNPSMLRL
jgi:hypothetical protein